MDLPELWATVCGEVPRECARVDVTRTSIVRLVIVIAVLINHDYAVTPASTSCIFTPSHTCDV